MVCPVADLVSFRKDHWTSAQARHKSMPTSQNHWTRSQMRHGSLLAVRACPVPEESFLTDDDEFNVEAYIHRKKLDAAWGLMKSCDIELWTDICNLYALIVAVEENPNEFKDYSQVVNEVAEAKRLMHNAALLRAVETIGAYDEGEWKQEPSPACVRRGSIMIVHEHRSDDETQLEANARHAEHAHAWELMKSCDKDKWTAVCHHHEEQTDLEKGHCGLDSLALTTPTYDSFRQMPLEKWKTAPPSLNLRTIGHLPANESLESSGSCSHAA